MKKSMKIALYQMISWRNSPKAWCAFALVFVFCLDTADNFLNYANYLSSMVQATEIYVYMGSTVNKFVPVLLAALLLMSDAPFITPRSKYEVLRIGKRSWILGKIVYIFLTALLFSLLTLLFTIVPFLFSGSLYFENSWSMPMEILAYDSPEIAITEFGLYFGYGEFIDTFSPYVATLLTIIYNSFYISMLCLIILAINTTTGRNMGSFIAFIIHIGAYVIYANGLLMAQLQKLSPLLNALPARQYLIGSIITPTHATLFFIIILTSIVFIVLKRADEVQL